ncbi:MAG: TlpA family protein disulfide reductase [Micrococcales bacterium]|nr:TlpA family protein disulfide reductase [Micrococcales bacterium]MCL2542140.1 TlpA family protein disulfide reductase [Nocardioidaceae bacterium]MCL2612527.1 TlpA family protein disulfide reductase [Nocardioidaceae bacterium]
MRARILPACFAIIAGAVLLTSCDSSPHAGGCSVSVASSDLVGLRQQAGIPDCTPGSLAVDAKAPAASMPATSLGCLGSKQRVALSDIKGPAIVNFWSSSCGPCRQEMPALAAFAKQYAGRVSVVGVDYLDTIPSAGLLLAKQSDVHYPLLADPCGDLEQSSLKPPGVMPFFYFVKADGSISGPTMGGLDSVKQIADLAQQHGIGLSSHQAAGATP